MDKYDYLVLCKETFMKPSSIHSVDSEFDAARFENTLISNGANGFRVVEKLYNSPSNWVIIMSKPIIDRSRRR